MTMLQCPFCKTRFEDNKTDDNDVNKCTCGAVQTKEGESINTKFVDWRNGWKRDKPGQDAEKKVNKSPVTPEDAGRSFNAYQTGCEFTAARHPTMEKMALVFGLGLAGETFEAIHEITANKDNPEKVMKELGDVWYYVAMLCTTFGLKLGAVIGNDKPDDWDKKTHPLKAMQIPTSVQTVGAVVEMIKKTFGHGHPINREKVANALQDVALPLSRSAYLVGKTTREVLETNNRKLAERYKDGFSTQASLNKKAD